MMCNFHQADLPRASFEFTSLVEADFSSARLVRSRFAEATCFKAKFVNANMRFVEAPHADFRGADLNDADLTEATLGSALFDESTLLRNTVLTGASVDKELLEFAISSGAIWIEGVPSARALEVLNGVARYIAAYQGDVDEGSINEAFEFVRRVGQRYAVDPSFDWVRHFETQSPTHIRALLFDAYEAAVSSIGE